MAGYPSDAASRTALRDRVGAAARLQAIANRLSTKCAGQTVAQQHAGQDGGCLNDGSTCLCPCHDRPTETEGAERG